MFALVKRPLLLVFALLLPLQGFAAPFMALAHCGETLPNHEQTMAASERDNATAMSPCHERHVDEQNVADQHIATDTNATHQHEGKLNCHEKSPCCHIAALPVTVAVTAAASPDGQVIASIRQAYADFLAEQPQRPPRPLPL
jgi:hypothetical protein